MIEAEEMVAREAGGGDGIVVLQEPAAAMAASEVEVDEDDPATWHLDYAPDRSRMPCLA